MARKNNTFIGPKQQKKKSKRSRRKNASPQANVPNPRAIRPQHFTAQHQRPSKSLVEKVCAISDPFCDGARGSRWPDHNNLATVPYSNRAHNPITTLGTGNLIFLTPVNAPVNVFTAATWSANNYTMNSTYSTSAGPTTLTSYFQGYRVVSAGFVIRSLMTVQNTSGYLIVTRGATMPALGAVIPQGNCLNAQVTTYPIEPGMEVPYVFSPLGTAARDFVPFTASASAQIVDPSWDVVSIEVVGAVLNGPCIDIEFFYNYEMELPSASILAQTMPKSAKANPVLMDASAEVSSDLAIAAKGALKEVGTFVLKTAAAALASRFAGPNAGRAIMNVD
jgi:hypothetical protein